MYTTASALSILLLVHGGCFIAHRYVTPERGLLVNLASAQLLTSAVAPIFQGMLDVAGSQVTIVSMGGHNMVSHGCFKLLLVACWFALVVCPSSLVSCFLCFLCVSSCLFPVGFQLFFYFDVGYFMPSQISFAFFVVSCMSLLHISLHLLYCFVSCMQRQLSDLFILYHCKFHFSLSFLVLICCISACSYCIAFCVVFCTLC
jgi:hypothetical protein